MKYTICWQSNRSFLEDEVNELIQKGWVPQGGLNLTKAGMYTNYYQAMVKYDEE